MVEGNMPLSKKCAGSSEILLPDKMQVFVKFGTIRCVFIGNLEQLKMFVLLFMSKKHRQFKHGTGTCAENK